MASDRVESSGSSRVISRLDTTAWTIPDSANPRIRGHRISHVIPNATESAWTMASIMRSGPQQPPDREGRLVHLHPGVGSSGQALRDTMSEVVLQQRNGDLVQPAGDRGDLREDVDAVRVFLDHPLDPSDLTLDPAEPGEQPILVLVIADHRHLLRFPSIPRRGMVGSLEERSAGHGTAEIFTRFRRS